MERDDVRDLLAIVQSVDGREVADLDVNVWQQLLNGLDPGDCAEAIMAHRREQPDVWLQPGHVVGRVKAMKRDRLDRMDPDERAKVIGGPSAPRDRYGYVDKSDDRDDPRSDIANFGLPVASERVIDALPRGTYIEADPAGWVYGIPSPSQSEEYDPDEKDNLRRELDSRIRIYMQKNPGCETKAQAEHAIRVKDRDRAEKILRKLKNHSGLADMFGTVGEAYVEGEVVSTQVIDAEVVNLDGPDTPGETPAIVDVEREEELF